jgi:hypothetical protein
MEWLKNNDAGSGAYKLESWKPGQETIYVRFKDWKSGPMPELKRMIVREVPRRATGGRYWSAATPTFPSTCRPKTSPSGYGWDRGGDPMASSQGWEVAAAPGRVWSNGT